MSHLFQEEGDVNPDYCQHAQRDGEADAAARSLIRMRFDHVALGPAGGPRRGGTAGTFTLYFTTGGVSNVW